MYYNQLYYGIQCLVVWGLVTFPASTPGISYSDHSPAYYLFTIIQNWVLDQIQKSRLKDENVICSILMSRITILGWSSLDSHGTTIGLCYNIPRNHDIEMTCWCQQEEISKTWDQEIFCPIWLICGSPCAGISLVRSVPLFCIFPMFTLSWDPAHNVITCHN